LLGKTFPTQEWIKQASIPLVSTYPITIPAKLNIKFISYFMPPRCQDPSDANIVGNFNVQPMGPYRGAKKKLKVIEDNLYSYERVIWLMTELVIIIAEGSS